jgi:mevalonate kinase
MPAYSASAPGKVILLGEHAVVYGQPAIAVPVKQVLAEAIVSANPRDPEGRVWIQAPTIGLEAELKDLPADNPLVYAINLVSQTLGVAQLPALTLRINSTIPVAAGLGSGAAVTVAIIRALSAFLGHALPDGTISSMAYEVEKIYHGTPSGIDNTVITYSMPVFFIKDRVIETLQVTVPFLIMIGDTGISSPTASVVAEVRRAWQAKPEKYERIFDSIGKIVRVSREIIENGQISFLGPLMNENHALLQEMDVSCQELDSLVEASRAVGALGAKLSGGGRGGNMITLVTRESASDVYKALQNAGAKRIISTEISPTHLSRPTNGKD